MRVPSEGFLPNLGQGLDAQTWAQEGLIDQLHLAPLRATAGGNSFDLRPHLELRGRRAQL